MRRAGGRARRRAGGRGHGQGRARPAFADLAVLAVVQPLPAALREGHADRCARARQFERRSRAADHGHEHPAESRREGHRRRPARFGGDRPRARCGGRAQRARRRRRRRADAGQGRDGRARRQSRVRREGVPVSRRARAPRQGRADHGRSRVGERPRSLGGVPRMHEGLSEPAGARDSGRLEGRRRRDRARQPAERESGREGHLPAGGRRLSVADAANAAPQADAVSGG